MIEIQHLMVIAGLALFGLVVLRIARNAYRTHECWGSRCDRMVGPGSVFCDICKDRVNQGKSKQVRGAPLTFIALSASGVLFVLGTLFTIWWWP